MVCASLGIRPGSTATSERCWGRKEAKNSAMTILAELQLAVLRYAMKGEKPLRANLLKSKSLKALVHLLELTTAAL